MSNPRHQHGEGNPGISLIKLFFSVINSWKSWNSRSAFPARKSLISDTIFNSAGFASVKMAEDFHIVSSSGLCNMKTKPATPSLSPRWDAISTFWSLSKKTIIRWGRSFLSFASGPLPTRLRPGAYTVPSSCTLFWFLKERAPPLYTDLLLIWVKM